MQRLIYILGTTYAVSLLALLLMGIVPGVPWSILLGFVVHLIPMALTIVWLLTRADQRLVQTTWARLAWPPIGIIAGLLLVWFLNCTANPAVMVALSLFAVWQLVAGSARPFVQRLLLSVAVLLLGYGTVWNINYLAGALLPLESLHDRTLLDFDIALYREWLGHDVEGAIGLYPVIQDAAALRFLEHAYMLYYDEIFIVLFALLYTGANVTRFLSIMFGSFLVGIPIFLAYPTIGPFTYAPETIQIAWHGSSTFKLMQGVLNDWLALREGAMLKGYGYFIAMPSMHVAIATVLQVFAWNCKPVFWLILPINVLLFASTFLLGWHYVLDAPAGLAVAGITLGAAQIWDRLPFRARTEAPPTTPANANVSLPETPEKR